jgi:uncharacterized phage protein gp47/JayE
MSLTYPDSPKEILDRLRTDVQNELPQSDPFLRESFLLALLVGDAGRFWDIYNMIQNLQEQLFPWSAEDDFLRRWGLFKGVDKKAASGATGNITVTGTVSSIIPENTIYQTTGGIQYDVIEQDYVITQHINTISSVTRVGSVVTVTTTASEHHYATNLSVTIAGANETEYNGTFIINVTGNNTFEYEISETPATPATGTITSTATFANVVIRSSETGEDKNIANGGKITLQSPIAGVDNDAYVQFGEISGGTEEETDIEYRDRINDIYAQPISHFNVSEIIQTALTVPGVTRVFVEETTPDAGQVTIYFMRDDDANPIPDQSEINTVKDEILKIKPAHMSEDDVIMPLLQPVVVDFTFDAITPDTDTLRIAVENNLATMFKEVPVPGENLAEEAYRSAIYQTIDPATGQLVSSFNLTSPGGDISVASDEIAIYGTTTWNI